MSEWIISDERLAQINRTAYRAGKCRSEAYTQVGADGEQVVRCLDCCNADMEEGSLWCCELRRGVPESGYCHLGLRRDA